MKVMDFFARETDPETSHIQLGVMGKDDNLRGYLISLFMDAGTIGLTGKEVQKFIPESQHQSHFRQITGLRRIEKLCKVPERRGGGQVHIHRDCIQQWIREASESQLIAFKKLGQY